jgi:hypothetical protein
MRDTFVKNPYLLSCESVVLNLQVGPSQQRRWEFLYGEADCLSGRVKAPIMYPPAYTNFGWEQFRRGYKRANR